MSEAVTRRAVPAPGAMPRWLRQAFHSWRGPRV